MKKNDCVSLCVNVYARVRLTVKLVHVLHSHVWGLKTPGLQHKTEVYQEFQRP